MSRTDVPQQATDAPSLFSFPNPVNEKAARTVAGGVVLLSLSTLLLSAVVDDRWLWLTVPIAAGFLARVLTGPTLSPLGQLATRSIAPRLGPAKLVPGPPKRFAQLLGLAMTGGAAIATALGGYGLAQVLLVAIIVAATLESVFALCLGCAIFAVLMRVGLVPERACEACANITLRHV
jgi:MFS family permease